jgi:ParB/RepB/Spo0J family partition protein
MKNIKTYSVEDVDISEIRLDESNPNKMDARKMDALKKMIQEKGMLQPILINQDNLMIDGEHRFLAAKEVGMEKIQCYRLDVTDSERRLLRQTMNKIKGSHNPVEDAYDLIKLSKEYGVNKLSEYLGQEEKQLTDFLESVNQVPESYLSMIIDEKKNTKRTHFISFKLTDEQAQKLLTELQETELSLKEVVLIPTGGMIFDILGT